MLPSSPPLTLILQKLQFGDACKVYIVAFSSKDEIIKVLKTNFFVQIFAHFLIALFPLLALCFLMNFEELLGCMKYMKAMIIYFVRFVDRNNQTSVLGHKMTFFIRSFFALFPYPPIIFVVATCSICR